MQTTMVNLTLVTILTYLAWLIFKVVATAYDSDLRKIPGPWMSRFTNIPLKSQVLAGNRDSYINRLHEKYGAIVRIAPKELSVAEIAAYHEMHKIGTQYSKGPWYHQISPGPTTDDTAAVFGIRDRRKAAARRKLLLQALTPAKVREWESQITKIVDKTVAKIKRDLKQDGVADIMKWWSLMAADVVGAIAFGQSFGMVENEKKGEMVEHMEVAFLAVGMRQELPWIWTLLQISPYPVFRFTKAMAGTFQRYAKVAVANTKLAAKGSGKTVFARMSGPDTPEVTEQTIGSEAINMFFAGTDTTSTALIYLVYAVLADETGTIKKKLINELSTCSDDPSWAELETKPYLNNVITETLRRYPPVGGSLTRVPPNEGATLGGYVVPKGTIVGTQAYSFHTNPTVFKDPLKFDPDRWNNPTPEMKEYYIPFGGSARSCLGANIARAEILRATAKLFKEIPNIELAPSTTRANMRPYEMFVIKPWAMKCEIQLA